MKDCKGAVVRATRFVFPDGTLPTIQSKNYQNLPQCPYIIHADTESIIRSIDTCAEKKPEYS